MQRLLQAVLCCLFLAIAGAAHAQVKLGEVLDKGGKPLNAAELRALLVGATVKGTALSNSSNASDIRYAPDGKVDGMVHTPRGSTTLTGTWTINEEKGQFCTDQVASFSGTRATGCNYYLKVGDEYYVSTSDTDRNAVAVKRTVTR